MSKQQVHEAKLTISREMTIPQYEQGGVELELRANGELLGRVIFSGAHVYFHKGRMSKHWNFSEFAQLLRTS